MTHVINNKKKHANIEFLSVNLQPQLSLTLK